MEQGFSQNKRRFLFFCFSFEAVSHYATPAFIVDLVGTDRDGKGWNPYAEQILPCRFVSH